MHDPDQSKEWHVFRAEGYYPDTLEPIPNYSVYPREDVLNPIWWKKVIASYDTRKEALQHATALEAAQRVHDA